MDSGGDHSDIRVTLAEINGGVRLISERVDNFNRAATERHDFLSDRVTKIAERQHEISNLVQVHEIKLTGMAAHGDRIGVLETDKTLRDGHTKGVWTTVKWSQVALGALPTSLISGLILAIVKGWL